MSTITSRLVGVGARAYACLDAGERQCVGSYLRGFWGHRAAADRADGVYEPAFAAMGLKILRVRLPCFRVWCYLRSFESVEEAGLMDLFCYSRLRSYFPMTARTRGRLLLAMDRIGPETASEMFFKIVALEYLGCEDLPDASFQINEREETTHIAAAAVVNARPDPVAREALMRRYDDAGGFRSQRGGGEADLYSTVTALFALRIMGCDMDDIRGPCRGFVHSLRRPSGGYAGHSGAPEACAQSTYHALLALGCLA